MLLTAYTTLYTTLQSLDDCPLAHCAAPQDLRPDRVCSTAENLWLGVVDFFDLADCETVFTEAAKALLAVGPLEQHF